jgi:hypothetical protein
MNDIEWKDCLFDAANVMSSFSLIVLFAHILHHNKPASPLELWNSKIPSANHTVGCTIFSGILTYEAENSIATTSIVESEEDTNFLHLNLEMARDFAHQRHQQNPTFESRQIVLTDVLKSLAVLTTLLRELANDSNITLANYGLPLSEPLHDNTDEEFDPVQEEHKWRSAVSTMNPGQLFAFNQLCATVANAALPRIVFLDAPGGTGKTFLENALLSYIRCQHGGKAIATASSGIAAILLNKGSTAHACFKIPLNCDERSQSAIRRANNAKEATALRQSQCFIWDEAPMSHRHSVDCVDRLMQDLKKDDSPFGRSFFVFSGDWRQTAPVVPRAGKSGILEACLFNCSWWHSVTILRLTTNERVLRHGNTPFHQQFASFLLRVGNGELSLSTFPQTDSLPFPHTELIELPPHLICAHEDIQQLLKWCYPNLEFNQFTLHEQCGTILTSLNSDVDMVNTMAIRLMRPDTATIELTSIDTVVDESNGDSAIIYPTEFLNSIDLPGIPPHKLGVKVGAPIICLRNIDAKRGLCNGTRCIIKSIISLRLLEATILTGTHVGHTVYIPRINMICTDPRFPFQLNRRQFPVKLAFAMTINKSQGQSLSKVGVYLPRPVFTHGQLYVALSRASDPTNLQVLIKTIPNEQGKIHPTNPDIVYTRNVVYREIIHGTSVIT